MRFGSVGGSQHDHRIPHRRDIRCAGRPFDRIQGSLVRFMCVDTAGIDGCFLAVGMGGSMTTPDIPTEISADAKSVADWFIWNHAGHISVINETLINDLAQVLTEFRGAPTTAGLTGRQRQAFDFIKTSIAAGEPPTMREIADGLGITLSRAHAVVKQLQHRGLITMVPRCPRSIAIVGQVDDVSSAHKNIGVA